MAIGPEYKGYLEWHYSDIEEFVKGLWGINWEAAAAMGFPHQNTYTDIEVTGGYQGAGFDRDGIEREALWMDEEFDLDEARELIKKVKKNGMPREEYADPGLELILNLLAHDKDIPTGKYRITVHW